jgi:hypothetical protein
MMLPAILIASLFSAGPQNAASGKSGTIESVRVDLAPGLGPVAQAAARIFARQIAERCETRVVTLGDAPFVVELAIDGTLRPESFRIADRAGGVIVASGGERGLLYGLGKLLRTSRYDRGGFTPGAWRGVSTPVGTMRGIYFATHFNNYYCQTAIEMSGSSLQ